VSQHPNVQSDEGPSTAPAQRSPVLVIEDHDDVRELVCATLNVLERIAAGAATGAGGIELARQIRPSIALVDVYLSDTDGFTVARQLRAEHPSIFLVGMSGISDCAVADRACFDAFLQKPFSIEDLERAIKGFAA